MPPRHTRNSARRGRQGRGNATDAQIRRRRASAERRSAERERREAAAAASAARAETPTVGVVDSDDGAAAQDAATTPIDDATRTMVGDAVLEEGSAVDGDVGAADETFVDGVATAGAAEGLAESAEGSAGRDVAGDGDDDSYEGPESPVGHDDDTPVNPPSYYLREDTDDDTPTEGGRLVDGSVGLLFRSGISHRLNFTTVTCLLKPRCVGSTEESVPIRPLLGLARRSRTAMASRYADRPWRVRQGWSMECPFGSGGAVSGRLRGW